MSSKLVLVALVLLLGYALAGVDAHVVSKRHTQDSWLSVPYAYLKSAYSEVEKAFEDIAKSPFVNEAWRKLTSALDKLNSLFYQPPEK